MTDVAEKNLEPFSEPSSFPKSPDDDRPVSWPNHFSAMSGNSLFAPPTEAQSPPRPVSNPSFSSGARSDSCPNMSLLTRTSLSETPTLLLSDASSKTNVRSVDTDNLPTDSSLAVGPFPHTNLPNDQPTQPAWDAQTATGSDTATPNFFEADSTLESPSICDNTLPGPDFLDFIKPEQPFPAAESSNPALPKPISFLDSSIGGSDIFSPSQQSVDSSSRASPTPVCKLSFPSASPTEDLIGPLSMGGSEICPTTYLEDVCPELLEVKEDSLFPLQQTTPFTPSSKSDAPVAVFETLPDQQSSLTDDLSGSSSVPTVSDSNALKGNPELSEGLNSPTDFFSKSETPKSVNVMSPNSNKSSESLPAQPNSFASRPSPVNSNSNGIAKGFSNNKRRRLSFYKTVREYVATLRPVDCVIMVEKCRPFNSKTEHMEYFKNNCLQPILDCLNGGPPLDADFGRDAYTSLYSLHDFDWRHPFPATTLAKDTPKIYRILQCFDNIRHSEKHAPDGTPEFRGTPADDLMRAALQGFEAIDKVRRGLCPVVFRHLILLALSPVSLGPLKAEAAALSSGAADSKEGDSGVLAELRKRQVAVSVFSPINLPSLRRLADLVNTLPPKPRKDNRWPTMIFSRELADWASRYEKRHGGTASPPPCQTPRRHTDSNNNNITSPLPVSALQNGNYVRTNFQPAVSLAHHISNESTLSPQQYRQANHQLPAPSLNSSGPNSIEQTPGNLIGPDMVTTPSNFSVSPGDVGGGGGFPIYQQSSLPQPSPRSLGGQLPNDVLTSRGVPPPSDLTTTSPMLSTHEQASNDIATYDRCQMDGSGRQTCGPLSVPPSNFGMPPSSGMSPASDPLLRVSRSSTASPMRAGPGSNIEAVGPSSAVGSNRGSSESLHETQQKRLQFRNDPTTTTTTPLCAGATGPSQQHTATGPSRQPPVVTTTTPYAVSQSPGPNGGQLYNCPPSQQAYPSNDMPPDTRRPTDDTGRTMGLNQRFPNEPSAISSIRPMQPQPAPAVSEERCIVWDGQILVRDVGVRCRLSAEPLAASRLNMQTWPNKCPLMLIQVERDSLIVQSLKAPMLHVPLQLSFENRAQEAAIVSCLRWHTDSALTLGIISSLPNLNTPVPSGLIAFACLFLAKGNRVCVLALTNSEEFRLELLMHQSSKKQQQLQQQSIAQSQVPPQQQQQLSQPSFPHTAGHEMLPSRLSSPSSPSAKFSRQSGMPPASGPVPNRQGVVRRLTPAKMAGYPGVLEAGGGGGPQIGGLEGMVGRPGPGGSHQVVMVSQQQQQRPYSLMQPNQPVMGSQMQQQQHMYQTSGIPGSTMVVGGVPYEMRPAAGQMHAGGGGLKPHPPIQQTGMTPEMCQPQRMRMTNDPNFTRSVYFSGEQMSPMGVRNFRDGSGHSGRFQMSADGSSTSFPAPNQVKNGMAHNIGEFQGNYSAVGQSNASYGGQIPMVNMSSYEIHSQVASPNYRNAHPPPTYPGSPAMSHAVNQMRPGGFSQQQPGISAPQNSPMMGYGSLQSQMQGKSQMMTMRPGGRNASGRGAPVFQMQQQPGPGMPNAVGPMQPMECVFDPPPNQQQPPLSQHDLAGATLQHPGQPNLYDPNAVINHGGSLPY
ncbi:hypothetical protein AAHC03_04595 [Spirometra sp. Aus1]